MTDSHVGPAGKDPHRWILASAGTGKTFQLAKRYLELVERGAKPETILATTFTRAAAAEIQGRVLSTAAVRVQGENEGTPSFDHACRVLEDLVASLPRLQIRTLDSLFASIVRGVSDLVGLPADARLLEAGEEQGFLREAIEVAARAEPEQVLATLETLSAGGHGVRVISTLERAVAEVLGIAERTEESAWRWPMEGGPDSAEVARAAEALDIMTQATDNKSFRRGATALFRHVGPDGTLPIEGCKAIPATTFAAAVLGDRVYSRKPLPEELIAPAAILIQAAVAGNARNLALRTAATHELIGLVGPALEAIKRRQGVVSFHDLVAVLDPDRLDLGGTLDELWFRLDGSITHMLLDEFQDTNWTQWRALERIVEEVVAYPDGSRSLFVVGDLKQSIYGWRGGEPALLERLDSCCGGVPVQFKIETLERSYRSGLPVIEAVNTVFSSIASNAAAIGVSLQAAASFGSWFKPHTTERTELGGEARLEVLPAPNPEENPSETAEGIMTREAARAAIDLLGPARKGNVAVLVRRNKAVALIVEALREEGVPAAGLGSGALIDTDAAAVVMQALRWAESPLDTLAAYDVARSPLAPILGIDPIVTGESVPRDVRERVSASLRRGLSRFGAGAMIDGWRRELAVVLDTRERIRLRQVVEFFDGLTGQPRSPGALVELALNARVEDPPGDGVYVMTIHQAKGLQFDTVIVADLAQSMGLKQEQLVWESPQTPTEKIERICVRYDKDSIPLAAIPAHEQATLRVVREGLCGLYVAMTRAQRTLLMQVPPPKLAKGKSDELPSSLHSAAGILRTAFGCGEGMDWDEPGIVWRAGEPTPEAHEGVAEGGKYEPRPRPTLSIIAGSTARRPRQAPPPSAGHGSRWPGLDLDSGTAALRGTAMHAALSTIAWLDEGSTPRAQLHAAMARACPRTDSKLLEGWCDDLEKALASAALAEIFAKPAKGEVTMLREAAFAHMSPGGLQRAIVDRIVIDVEGEHKAVIYDFKTNRSGEPSDLLVRYRDQLTRYQAIVAVSLRLPLAAVGAVLVDLDHHEVLSVNP
jgi:ATP-dependent exoDNAse (exonuclease V) beta subunit